MRLNSAPRLKSVMEHEFSRVPNVSVPRSTFNRSHGVKTTFDGGYLVPFFVDEIIPGDTLNCSLSHVIRMATPIKPLMDNIRIDFFWFFVPMRLVWDNFERFMGDQNPNPGDSTDYLMPVVEMYNPIGAVTQSLPDYMGIPTYVPALEVNALPFRAYNRIWNEHFRDQNLQDSVVLKTDDTPDNTADYVPLRRGKRHDQFTSALPFAQKGDPVTIGVGATAPVAIDQSSIPVISDGDGIPRFEVDAGSSRALQNTGGAQGADWSGGAIAGTNTASWDATKLAWDGTAVTGTADLSAATAITINDLRAATALQRLLEKDARGGTRYVEQLQVQWGVTSPDQRLQRTEYLGGGSTALSFMSVPGTNNNAGSGEPQGNLAAFGQAVGLKHAGFVQSFTEHGYVIGLMSARADLTYQQGLDKMWKKRDRLELAYPTLAHLGEDQVLNSEIYAQGPLVQGDPDDAPFGYQERYYEYRYKPSKVTGAFRSNTPGGSLDVWHLSQDFDSLPLLNADFIEEDPPFDRVVATPTEPHFLADLYVHQVHVRPLPVYSIPSLTDRF